MRPPERIPFALALIYYNTRLRQRGFCFDRQKIHEAAPLTIPRYHRNCRCLSGYLSSESRNTQPTVDQHAVCRLPVGTHALLRLELQDKKFHTSLERLLHSQVNKGRIKGLHAIGMQPVVSRSKSTRLNSSHANISYAVFC